MPRATKKKEESAPLGFPKGSYTASGAGYIIKHGLGSFKTPKKLVGKLTKATCPPELRTAQKKLWADERRVRRQAAKQRAEDAKEKE